MATQVNFYVLPDGQPRDRYACRLVEDAYVKGERVFVRTRDAAHTRAIDDLLWTFRGGSFVPHELYAAGVTPTSPVLVGHDAAPPALDTLVNLTDAIHDTPENSCTVVEIVDSDSDSKARARERYRQYRDRGYSLHSQSVEPGTLQNSE